MNKDIKILVVDDFKTNILLYANLLEEEGYTVFQADSGLKAISKTQNRLPDIVLLDVQMPKINGIEVCSLIKSNPKTKHIIIIHISSIKISVNDRILGLEYGADDYITRPISNNELLARIKAFVRIVRTEKELRKTKNKYKNLYENAADMFVSIEAKNKIITECNQTFVNNIGYDKTEIIGKSIFNFYTNKSNEYIKNIAFPLFMKKGIIQNIELQILKKNGLTIDVLLNGKAVRDKNQNILYNQTVIRNISKRKQAEKKLKEAQKKLKLKLEQDNLVLEKEIMTRTIELKNTNEQLTNSLQELENSLQKEKEIVNYKSQIVSTVSHQFRTPLSIILSSIELIEQISKTIPTEYQAKKYQDIKSSVSNMTTLLDDVLLLQKIEEGQVQVRLQEINFEKFCLTIIQEYELLAENNNRVIFNSNLHKKTILIDSTLLNNIVRNLLNNALKFSAKNKVELTISSNNNNLVIRIKNYGISIPEKELDNIYKRFYRAKNAEGIEGTGIGLSIVKRNIELLKGVITVDSTIKNGTTFTVVLPMND